MKRVFFYSLLSLLFGLFMLAMAGFYAGVDYLWDRYLARVPNEIMLTGLWVTIAGVVALLVREQVKLRTRNPRTSAGRGTPPPLYPTVKASK